MFAHCYFDVSDLCMGFDSHGIMMSDGSSFDNVVGEGQYMLPAGLNPIGYDAATLLPFALKMFRPLVLTHDDE